eukprot:723281-Amphidinium_carterae.2
MYVPETGEHPPKNQLTHTTCKQIAFHTYFFACGLAQIGCNLLVPACPECRPAHPLEASLSKYSNKTGRSLSLGDFPFHLLGRTLCSRNFCLGSLAVAQSFYWHGT